MYASRALLLALLSLAEKAIAAPPGCDGNSCERAFNGDPHTLAAASFCSQFTTATTLTTNGFPTYATAACTLVAQISSICSCAYPASSQTTSTNTPTVTPTSSSISSSRSSSLSSSRSSSLSNSVSSSSISSSSSSMSSSSSSKSSQLSSSSSKVASSSSSSAIITGPNSSGTAIQTSVTSSTSSQFASCVPDNCLRAFDQGNGGAFCSLFTLGGTNAPALPTYATQCGPNTSSRASSACTCLNNGNPTASFSSTSPPPTPISSTVESSTTSTTSQYDPGCGSDNCLRAFDRGNGGAFCSLFTLGGTYALPTYATQCGPNTSARVSSACTCLNDNGDPTTSFSSMTLSPTPVSSTTESSTTSTTSQYDPGCNPDNCLRAFDRGNAGAFCSLFTLGGTYALPTYATQCGPSTSARVSSACTCLNNNGGPTASFSSTSPSPTPISSTTESSTVSTPASCPIYLPAGCNRDNCFRAMERQGGVGATAFCATFTTAVVTALSALPTYYTQCTTAPVLQISSACSCLSIASASASASAYAP